MYFVDKITKPHQESVLLIIPTYFLWKCPSSTDGIKRKCAFSQYVTALLRYCATKIRKFLEERSYEAVFLEK